MARVFAAAAALVVFSPALLAVDPDAMAVAGTRPFERPADAPALHASDRDRSVARQLRGVATPYPTSLRFVANHGGWFTPFTEPGMTGRYDLRGFHNQRHPEPDLVRGGGG